jgi:hypothetical protein
MKKIARFFALVAAPALIAAVGNGVPGYADTSFKHIVDEIIEAEHVEDIVHYAVTNQQSVLARIPKPNLFLKLSQKDLDKIKPSLLKLLKDNVDIKKAGFTVSSVHVGLGQQVLDVDVSGDYKKDNVKGALTLSVDVAMRSVGNLVVFDPYLKGAKIDGLKAFGVNLEPIKGGLNLVLPLLKDVISDGLRATLEPLTATLRIKPPSISDFKEFSSKPPKKGSPPETSVEFVPRPFVYNPTIQDIAIYVGKEGLFAVANAQNLPKPAPKPAKPAPVARYPDVKQADTDAAYAKYKAAFLDAFENASGQKAADAATLAVTKGYVAQTVRDIVAGAPIAAKISVDNKTEFSADIKLTGEVDLKCGDKLNACKYKDVCAEKNPCKEMVKVQGTIVVPHVCERMECVVHKPFGGCLVRNPIKFSCEKTVPALLDRLVDSTTPLCKAFRPAAAAVPGLCQTASNLTKAQCDVFAAGDAAACQAEQEFNNVLARNPVAEVYGNAATKGAVDASAANLTVADDFKNISASLTAKGSAHINSHINLRMKKTTPAQAVCNPTWTGDPQADVTVDAKDLGLDFVLQSHDVADDKLKLAYETPDEKEIKVNLSQSPIEIIRTATNGAKIRCDRVGVPLKLAGIAMALDANLRGMEALTKKIDVPQKLGKQKLRIDLPGFELPIGADKHKMQPAWGDKVFAFNLK